MPALIQWIAFQTVFGPLAVGAAVYLLLKLIRRISHKGPQPMTIAATVGVLAILTMPSVPRYLFEKDVLRQLEQYPYMRLVDRAYAGDLMEPVTLFRAPIATAVLAMPNRLDVAGFTQIVLRYKEEPDVAMVDPDCEKDHLYYARPDGAGVFRESADGPIPMSEAQREAYCRYNWARERQAVNEAMIDRLRGFR